VEALGGQTELPKGLKKIGNSGGEDGLKNLEFEGHGGRAFLEFFIAVKMFMPPVAWIFSGIVQLVKILLLEQSLNEWHSYTVIVLSLDT